MNKLKFLMLILTCISLNSCFIGKTVTVSRAKKEFTVENYAIPPEFGEDKNTYLIGILMGTKHYKKSLQKKFKNAYNGKYLLLTEEELNSEKYNDLNKFRYIFLYGEGTTTSTTYSNGLTSHATYKKYYVYDRLNKKKYITGAQFPFYGKAMEIYLENLEEKRIKN